jgi:hypothetical protein
MPFARQLEAVLGAYDKLVSDVLPSAQAVFKRYFLSDAANQQDEVVVADMTDCTKSIIQQAPLDGTKIALWVYLMTGVQARLSGSGLYAVSHGGFRHLWNGSAHNLAANSEYQTRLLFNEYNMQLIEEGCTLEANCIRTWFFVNDVDLNYGGVVRARNQFFFTQGTHRTYPLHRFHGHRWPSGRPQRTLTDGQLRHRRHPARADTLPLCAHPPKPYQRLRREL